MGKFQNLKHLPMDCGGNAVPRSIVIGFYNNAGEKGYPKIFIGRPWRKGGM